MKYKSCMSYALPESKDDMERLLEDLLKAYSQKIFVEARIERLKNGIIEGFSDLLEENEKMTKMLEQRVAAHEPPHNAAEEGEE